MKGFNETSLEVIAKHEAGHFLMNWLLEREPGGIAIMENVGGVTIDDSPEPEYLHQVLLKALAGMAVEEDSVILDQLLESCDKPELFDKHTDSYWASKTLVDLARQWKVDPQELLGVFVNVCDDTRHEFGQVIPPLVETLMEQLRIDKASCITLYRQWDQVFNMDSRPPKSDIVGRKIAKFMGWNVPDGKAMNWNFLSR